ncbi:hypothetical protein QBC38DRAFT_464748 [Podospora fimiseda]|uniref:Uncharacterized protein n=1 Tax=Podospora fimiseda TaxID=252190 RepID=A0AAN7H5I2_9PEZI|nr:hypothetical protein QBC38DRAFT_464748 [Podospora fimiseda]
MAITTTIAKPPNLLPSIPDLELESFYLDIDTTTPQEEEFTKSKQQQQNPHAYELVEDITTTTATSESSSSETTLNDPPIPSRSNTLILPHRKTPPIRFTTSPSPFPSPPLTTTPSFELYESYTITYHPPSPTPSTTSSLFLFGFIPVYTITTTRLDQARVLSILPNPLCFTQEELYNLVQRAICNDGTSSDLEIRLKRLDWKVQEEIMELVGDKITSFGGGWEWRVVFLEEGGGGAVEEERGGGPRDPEGGVRHKVWERLRRRKVKKVTEVVPLIEYRIILRGKKEVGGPGSMCDRGNSTRTLRYNRYSGWPDGAAGLEEKKEEEEEVSVKRRWSVITRSKSSGSSSKDGCGIVEKYVDF